MKKKRKTFKGIEYVVFDELPLEQQDNLLLNLAEPQFINILVDGVVIRDCMAYRIYSDWYDQVYLPHVVMTKLGQHEATGAPKAVADLS